MKTKHLGAGLTAMVILGAGSFWGLAALAGGRIGAPRFAAVATLSAASDSPEAILRAGTRRALDAARRGFRDGRRGQAVMAVDAARRAARVGRAQDMPGFAPLLIGIEDIRTAVQNGHDADAARLVDGALAAFETVDALGHRANGPARTPPRPRPPLCDGATVINAEGVRIGELQHIDGDMAEVAFGKRRDLFGFWDLGERIVRIPVGRLLAGERRRLGATVAALASTAIQPDEVRREIASRASR